MRTPALVLVVGLQLKKNSYPANMWLLAAFTLAESFTVATGPLQDIIYIYIYIYIYII